MNIVNVKLKTITVQGVAVTIRVTDDGLFVAEVAGRSEKAATLSALVSRIRLQIKATSRPISIPISIVGTQLNKPLHRAASWVSGFSVRNATIVGRHGGTGNLILVDDKTGERFQERATFNSVGTFSRRLSADEIKQYERLALAHAAAERAVRAFVDDVKANDLSKQVDEAIAHSVDLPPDDLSLEDDGEDPRERAGRKGRRI